MCSWCAGEPGPTPYDLDEPGPTQDELAVAIREAVENPGEPITDVLAFLDEISREVDDEQ